LAAEISFQCWRWWIALVDLEPVKSAMMFSEFVEGSVENSNLAKFTPISLFDLKVYYVLDILV
jgi:hypothetical protein